MTTGAVIVAAGLSSRMHAFKPLLPMGQTCVVQRIVSTFQSAGVHPIVVVTGHRADELKQALDGYEVVFLHNERYQTTQMFDSVKIGLAYVRDHCDRTFFTPVDVPLFTAGTLDALLKCSGELCCPVCDARRGHPILFSKRVMDRVLTDPGEGGLRGALSRCGAEERLVPVPDRGILRDMDTPAEYRALLAYQTEQEAGL